MKKLGICVAAAMLSVGISGMSTISSQAAYRSIVIGNDCLSGGNNCSFGQNTGNYCNNWQSVLSGLSNYYPSTYNSNNGFLNDCLTNSLMNDCSNGFSQNSNNNCDDAFFPGQCPWDNKPGVNIPEQNKPEQNNPGQNKPGQNKPGQNAPEQNNPEQNETENDTSTSAYVQQVIRLVNEERAKAGLSPLTESAALSKAAAVRAKETTQNFSHTRPDGTSFSTVLRENGISYTSSGENIAYGQRTPQEVMNTWMNSSGHRANILNSNYTTIGVGCYQNSNGTLYWTQLFTR